MEGAAHWIRGNAGVLALLVAVLTFIGGIGAAARYFSTLATTDHVTAAVIEALEPFDVTVADLQGAVAGLRGLPTRDDVAAAVSEATEPLNETVDRLEESVADLQGAVARLDGTVGGIETSVGTLSSTVETLSGMLNTVNTTVQGLDDSVDTLDDSVDTLNNATLPRLVSCVVELHGRRADGGGAGTSERRTARPEDRSSPDELPDSCMGLMNLQAASGR